MLQYVLRHPPSFSQDEYKDVLIYEHVHLECARQRERVHRNEKEGATERYSRDK